MILTPTTVKTSRIEEWSGPLLILIMIIPILGAYFFLGESLRLDESQSLWQVSRHVSGILVLVAGDVHVPLYHVLLHFWRLYLGESVTIARLFSLLFFILSIPAVYFLGKRAYSARAGLLVALLLAISPFMNWYGNEIRMYTLFTFLTIVSQYLFLRILQERESGAGTWVLYTLVAILGIFTHYFFFLNLFAQALFYLVRRSLFPAHTLRRFISAGIIVALAFAPWVWYVLFRGVAGFQDPTLIPPSFVDLFSAFSQFLFGFQNDGLNTVLLSLWPVAVIFGLVALGRYRRFRPETEYLMITIVLSFGITFIGSHLFAPIFVSRYLIFTLPSLYLLVISLFATYTPRFRPVAQWSLVALMLITLGIEITNPRSPVKEDYKDAIAYVSSHATVQDTILVSAPYTIYPVKYYYRGPAPVTTLPVWNQYAYGPIPDFNEQDLPSLVASTTKNYQNVYVLLSYNQGTGAIIKDYFDSHYERLSAQTFSNDLNLYVYKLRYNTRLSAIPAATNTEN